MANKKIIVIDDEEVTNFIYKKLFEDFGIDVDTAAALEPALELIGENVYDAVITDLRLGGAQTWEGYDVIRFAREKAPETGIIVISGCEEYEAGKKALELGAAFYFEKPVHPNDIISALKKLEVLPGDTPL